LVKESVKFKKHQQMLLNLTMDLAQGVLRVTFRSELFLPNLISLEFNSPLFPFLYFCSFTINFGSVSSANNKPLFLAVHSTV